MHRVEARPWTVQELRRLIQEETQFRTGMGFDVHPFAQGRKLVLAGVEIPHDRGLLGHSDADVIVHAAMDAVLGAAGLPDIGTHFPDTLETFRDANSLELATQVTEFVDRAGFGLVNLDIMVLAEEPRLKPHRERMLANLARAFAIPVCHIGLKATTMEKLGFVGRGEGIAAMATALVKVRHQPLDLLRREAHASAEPPLEEEEKAG